MNAIISECGKYRYELRRPFDAPREMTARLMFLMANPSVADASKNDATIRRCISFSHSWGYIGAFCVGNLYAWRATDPKALRTAVYPIGNPLNDDHLRLMAIEAEIIVLAWGTNTGPIKKRADQVMELLWPWNRKFRVIGWTKAGEPVHPLMQRADLKLLDFGTP